MKEFILISLAILVIAGFSYVALLNIKQGMTSDIKTSLNSTLRIINKSYDEWRLRKESEIHIISKDPRLLELTRKLLTVPRNRESLLKNNALKEIRRFFQPIMDEKDNDGIFIIAPDSISLASWRDVNVGTKNFIYEKRDSVLKDIWNGHVRFISPIPSDVELKDANGNFIKKLPTMFFGAPITDENNRVIAIFTIRINPQEDFISIAKSAEFGETGEVYLVDNNGWILTNSRYYKSNIQVDPSTNSVISTLRSIDNNGNTNKAGGENQTNLTLSAKELTFKKSGSNISGYNNYAGAEVVGVWAWNSSLHLGLVVEEKEEEAFRLFGQIKFIVTLRIIFVLIIVVLLILTLMSLRKKFYSELEKANDELSAKVKERTLELEQKNSELIYQVEEKEKISARSKLTEYGLDRNVDEVYLLNNDGTLEWVNQSACRNLGYSCEELMNKKFYEIIPDFSFSDFEKYWATLRKEKYSMFESKFITRDGKTYPVEVTSNYVRFNDKEYDFVFVREIAGRKMMMEQLKQSVEELHSLFESSSDAIFAWDQDLKLIYANKAGHSLLGINESPIGYSIEKFGTRENVILWEKRIKSIFKNKRLVKVSDTNVTGNETIYSESTIYPIRNSEGTVISVGVIYRDITELKKADIERKNLFKHSRDLLAIAGFDNKLKQVNPAWEKLLGWSQEELLHKQWMDLLHKDDIDYASEINRQLGNGKQVIDYESRFICKNGSYKWLSWNVYPLNKEGLIFAVGRDDTEKRLDEERLKKFAKDQATLLKEVNHRVKNNLLALLSILHKEEAKAKKESVPELLPLLIDLEGRVKSLSIVHNLLSATQWAPISLASLCENIINGAVKGMINANNYHCSIEKSNLKIEATQAHHLTIVLNELATNSVKHRDKNKESLQINVKLDKNGKAVSIIYSDNGPGFPKELIEDDLSNVNIGIGLIKGIVEHSLNGNVKFSNNNGAVTSIQFETGEEING